MIFNEDKLQQEIIKTWGEFGAHNEVFNAMRNQISKVNKSWLELARCPDLSCCNGVTVLVDMNGEPCPEPCQWCEEKERVLEHLNKNNE